MSLHRVTRCTWQLLGHGERHFKTYYKKTVFHELHLYSHKGGRKVYICPGKNEKLQVDWELQNLVQASLTPQLSKKVVMWTVHLHEVTPRISHAAPTSVYIQFYQGGKAESGRLSMRTLRISYTLSARPISEVRLKPSPSRFCTFHSTAGSGGGSWRSWKEFIFHVTTRGLFVVCRSMGLSSREDKKRAKKG